MYSPGIKLSNPIPKQRIPLSLGLVSGDFSVPRAHRSQILCWKKSLASKEYRKEENNCEKKQQYNRRSAPGEVSVQNAFASLLT